MGPINLEGEINLDADRHPAHDYVADTYTTSGTYTTSIPGPPRIGVPVPVMHGTSVQDIQMSRPLFLYKDIAWLPSKLQDNYSNWQYLHRRQAQRILPYLYLGPSSILQAGGWLEKEGISLVIGVANSMQKVVQKGLERATAAGASTRYIDLAPGQPLIAAFPTTFNHIKDHVNRLLMFDQEPRVYVFCESGNERSAGLVIAFLTEAYDLHFTQAIRAVQTVRFSVVADETMKQSMSSYYDLICARRAVDATPSNAPNRAKRGLERDDEGDEEAEGDRQYAPFGERMDTR